MGLGKTPDADLLSGAIRLTVGDEVIEARDLLSRPVPVTTIEVRSIVGIRALGDLLSKFGDGCAHAQIDPLPPEPDGSVFGRCAGCGDDGFPIVDVSYELWRLLDFEIFPVRGRTARQRRANRRARIQRARRWSRWRRGLRLAP